MKAKAQEQLPQPDRLVTISGSLSGSATTYTAAGIEGSRNPFTWLLNGNVTLSAGEFSLPFSATASERHRAFQQPFNQLGISPEYRWIKGHIGYRSLNFSPYTLGGARFLGGGVELNPGILRFGAMYGRFQKPIEDDSTRSQFALPAYRRMGAGFKLGVGTEQSHVDLLFFRAADDTTSIAATPTSANILPAENVVLGLKTRFRIARRLNVEGEYAASALNQDSRAQVLDWAEDMPSFARSLITPRSSFIFQTAARAAITLSLTQAQVSARYTRIGPDYRTLGAYYFDSDVENFTLAPGFSLLNRKVRVKLSGGVQRNNVDNRQLTTTRRLIGSANVSLRLGKNFNLNTQYNNYSTGVRSGSEPLLDTLRTENLSQSFRIVPRYTLRTDGMMHTLSAGFSQQGFSQRNLFSDETTDATRTALSATYGLTLSESGLAGRLNYSYSNNESEFRDVNLTGVNVSVSTDFLEETLFANATLGFISRTVADSISARSITGNLNLSYRFTDRDTFSADVNYGNNPLSPLDSDRFTELITTFSYVRRFGR